MSLRGADTGAASNSVTVAGNSVSRAPADARSSVALEASLAGWLRGQKRSMLRQMVTLVSQPGILSLAGGLPDPSLFPREELAKAYADALRSDRLSLQYGGSSEVLKSQIVELAALRGITTVPEQVVLTTGAQQGIDIAARALLEQGGAVLVEEMSYTGIHQTCAPRNPEWLSVPTDLALGSDPEVAASILVDRAGAGLSMPDLCYLIPDGHNPLGVSMAIERRRGWCEVLQEHQVPLIEDDPYGLVWFGEPFEPPFKTLMPENTVYLSSFSKILAPGVRLGFMIVPEEIAERIGVVKESGDLECSGLTQRAVSALLRGESDDPATLDRDFLDRHLSRVRSLYSDRRDALLAALETHLAGVATWSRPRGGMFAWAELPEGIDTVELLQRCLKHEKVAFLPGIAFAAPNEASDPALAQRARRSMRLSFSTLAPDQFDPAIRSIARQIENYT